MSYRPIQPDAVSAATKAFRQARWRADLQKLRAWITGQSTELLCYYEVRELLQQEAEFAVSRQEIPLASIVGSVDRCTDYTPGFLPLNDSDQERWTGVKRAFASGRALPPIQVYRTGDVYFVIDGNHRVSVARQLGRTHIEAHVVHIRARVPFSGEDPPAELARKRHYAHFLEVTRLHEVRPQADPWLATPEHYEDLQAEIGAHRRFLSEAGRRGVSAEEAAAHWYDSVYLPAVEVMRRCLSPLPAGWTEASGYLALRTHHSALEEALGQEVGLELAAEDLAQQMSQLPARLPLDAAPARAGGS